MFRVIFSLIVCSLAYPLLVYSGPGSLTHELARFVGLVTVGTTLMVVLPLLYWFTRRGWLSLWPFLLSGAIWGAVVSLPFLRVEGFMEPPALIVTFGAIGTFHGVVVWLLAVYRNSWLMKMASLYRNKGCATA